MALCFGHFAQVIYVSAKRMLNWNKFKERICNLDFLIYSKSFSNLYFANTVRDTVNN